MAAGKLGENVSVTAWDTDQTIDLASSAYGLKVKDDDGDTSTVTVGLVGGIASYTAPADTSSTAAGSITFQLKLAQKAQQENPIKIVITVADSNNANLKTEYFISFQNQM